METMEEESKCMSISLYHYMCKHVVGTQKYVNTIRLMNTVCDNLTYNEQEDMITSGSFGEGLEMLGSDLDLMFVSKFIKVHNKNTSVPLNPSKSYFSLMTEDTKPGYAMLRLLSHARSHHFVMEETCEKFRGDFYLSNALYKQVHLSMHKPVVHGPCVSDIRGNFDFAYCLHGNVWAKPASRWTYRSNHSWPSENTMRSIIRHGMLFVPIGSKGSPHEELEWRISFSVGEKFLIYSFSHTQLLCYALMKILLKDVINSDRRCTDLLCSYYLKTIIFWISEELPTSVWTPDKLIPCFMRCFRRLIYCVQYKVCPHYFIPENNLFENTIEGLGMANLINKLRQLFSYGWRCILYSKQISYNSVLSCDVYNDRSLLYIEDVNKFLKSPIFFRLSYDTKENNFIRAVRNIISLDSHKLKHFHAYFISALCNKKSQSNYLNNTIGNKIQYKQHKSSLSNLLMSINHDIASGWLMLASFFYAEKQYNKSLTIILYALSKCTNEKLFRGKELSVEQQLLVKRYLEHNQGFVSSLKFFLLDYVIFVSNSFIPMELLIEESLLEVPPVVYAHFLSFLCNHHLNNVQACQNSLDNLILTIASDYFIGKGLSINSSTYYCLGTVLQLRGDNEYAKQAFTKTAKLIQLVPNASMPSKKLYMLASFRAEDIGNNESS